MPHMLYMDYGKITASPTVSDVFGGVDVSAVIASVRKLEALLNCGNPRVEVAAARTILKLSNKFLEDDLKARVNLLESQLRGGLRRG